MTVIICSILIYVIGIYMAYHLVKRDFRAVYPEDFEAMFKASLSSWLLCLGLLVAYLASLFTGNKKL